MGPLVRGAMVALGVVMMLVGLLVIGAGGIDGFGGLWLVAMGAFLVIVVAIERQRYRSEAAERSNASSGPGGGEPLGQLEARFRPTAEVFVDPTTGTRMRVVVDPANGERRYVAEG
jgi:hypothetical protein